MEQTVIPPDMDDLLLELKTEIFAQLNCVQIGKIETVNPNQTCEILIQVKRTIPGGKTRSYPKLVDCPYFVLSGGGAYIDMPIKKGDSCLVLFNDRDMDTWWDTGNVAEPNSKRKHSLSDGFALVGISNKSNALPADGQFVRILGTSGAGAEKEAARKGDQIQSTSVDDSIFWTWVSTISAAVNSLAPGSVPSVPTSLTGKITGGSTEVKIG